MSADKVLVHIMDGLGCPLRNKSNLIVKFELLESDSRCIVQSVSTTGSTHLRQLTWDQKLLVDLPFKVCDIQAAPSYVMSIALLRPCERSVDSNLEVVAETEKNLTDLLVPLSQDSRNTSRRHDFIQSILSLQLKPAFTTLESSKFSTSLSSSGSEVRLRVGLMIPDEKQTQQTVEEMGNRTVSAEIQHNEECDNRKELVRQSQIKPQFVQSEEERLNNMLKTRVIHLFDSVFQIEKTKMLSSDALVEFARLQISENCAQEIIRTIQNFRDLVVHADMPYAVHLTSAVRKSQPPLKSDKDSCKVETTGARKFLLGYMSVHYLPLAVRCGRLDRVAVPLNEKALATKLKSMETVVAETQIAIEAIRDICLVECAKDASHSSR